MSFEPTLRHALPGCWGFPCDLAERSPGWERLRAPQGYLLRTRKHVERELHHAWLAEFAQVEGVGDYRLRSPFPGFTAQDIIRLTWRQATLQAQGPGGGEREHTVNAMRLLLRRKQWPYVLRVAFQQPREHLEAELALCLLEDPKRWLIAWNQR